MLAIETKALTKYYGKHLGIKEVSLSVPQGSIYGFIGPNGAGKSTAIRTLLGLLTPTSGTATLLGYDIRKEGPSVRERIGYLPAEVHYYDEMTSRELLEYHAGFYPKADVKEIDRLAKVFELDLEKKITDLSFGNKKKCAIIQTVLHKPDLLILDEPTSGLDPLMQNRFFELLEERHAAGATIFFSSHILSEVQRLCQTAAVIRQGEIIAIEDISALMTKQVKKCRLLYESIPDQPQLPEGCTEVHWNDDKVTFAYTGPINTLIGWLAAQNLVVEEPDLETIFMNYYER